MTQKDFKVKKGLVVGGNISSNTNGFIFDYDANTLAIGGSLVAYASNVNTVQSNLATLTTSVNTIKANVDSVSANIVAVETRATANINAVQSNVTSLTNSVDTISANVNTVQSNLASLTTSVNSISANVDTVQSNLSALTTSVNTIKANVDAVQSNVDSIINGSTAFTGNISMQKDLTVSGNLTVGGTSTIINSVDTVVTDRVITLSNGAVSGTFDSGLIISRGIDANVFIGFDESADQFVVGYTTEPGGNTVTDYAISSYANVRFNNIVVDGTVDGVDIASLGANIGSLQTNINTVQSNLTSLTTSVDTIRANVDSVAGNVTTLTSSVNTIRANVDSVSSNVANIINGTTAFTGAVTFQDNISATRAILNTQLQLGSNVTTGVGAASTTIFTFPGAIYRGAELLLMVQDVTNSQYQLSKMLIVHDGNTVDWTEYGVITTGTSDLTTFTAAIDASDVITVSSTGGSANKKITVASHYLIQ